MSEPTYHIGEVASRTGLSLRTVRYYEDVGLVVPNGRTEGGFRLYRDSDVKRLLLVRALKPADLSMDELHELLRLRDAALERNLGFGDVGRLRELVDQAATRIRLQRERLIAAEIAVDMLAAMGRPSTESETRASA